ncbi:hypothetical protein F3Y22_tig00018853pilonHSYRG00022 [Hibiscus syriacus]|uniref:Uncharacterized protein n=1 Tax=Hibiscus syriacus TaxID=106335 RepID=A0A6A3BVB1_HIBSY|nr:hypothetical protein F3Y22_tig00018853pilonHSYRG00022 [Hibiscus syriacus]
MEKESKEKLREVCDALETTESELTEEREKVASLLRKAESLDLIEGQRLLLQKELEESSRVESLDRIEERWLETWEELQRHKEKLKDACRRQCELEEQSVRKKNEFGEKLQEVCDALENANIELTEERERTSTLIKRIESSDHLEEQLALRQKEIEQYKERELKQVQCLGENIRPTRKSGIAERIEASLLAQVEVEETINKEKDELVRITEEKDGIIVNLQQQVASLVQELKAREHDMIMEAFVDELKIKNKNLLENNTMLSTDRENLLGFITSLGDRIGELSGEDGKLMGLLGRIVQSDELYGALKENNKSLVSSPVAIKHDPLIEERSPFRELN